MSEWEVMGKPQLPAVRSNFVAPDPPRIDAPGYLQPQPHELIQVPSVQQIVTLNTTHVDRAKGFAITTSILATVVGVFAVILAVVMFREPLIFAVVLSYFFTAFVLTWVISFVWHQATSPDGTALFQIFGGFRLLKNEQKFRHERIRHKEGMPQPWERKRKGRK